MANTYTQLYIHFVFAVKNRESLIKPAIESELYAYICGACKSRKHHVIAINGYTDHIHMLVGMHPTENPSDLMQSIKIQTSKWMHERHNVQNFSWQSGFGAFSYSKSFLPAVEKYISNQKKHHESVSFDDEIREIFQSAGIDFDDSFILKGVSGTASST